MYQAQTTVSTDGTRILINGQPTYKGRDQVEGLLFNIHGGDDVETGKVGDASDLVQKVEYLRSRPWFEDTPRPITTNEARGERAFDALLRRGVSFGLHSTYFQTVFPPRWGVWENETTWFLKKVRALTGTPEGG